MLAHIGHHLHTGAGRPEAGLLRRGDGPRPGEGQEPAVTAQRGVVPSSWSSRLRPSSVAHSTSRSRSSLAWPHGLDWTKATDVPLNDPNGSGRGRA